MLAFLSRLTCGATFLAISLVLFYYGFRSERVTCERSEDTCLITDHGLFDGSTDTVRISEIVEHRFVSWDGRDGYTELVLRSGQRVAVCSSGLTKKCYEDLDWFLTTDVPYMSTHTKTGSEKLLGGIVFIMLTLVGFSSGWTGWRKKG